MARHLIRRHTLTVLRLRLTHRHVTVGRTTGSHARPLEHDVRVRVLMDQARITLAPLVVRHHRGRVRQHVVRGELLHTGQSRVLVVRLHRLILRTVVAPNAHKDRRMGTRVLLITDHYGHPFAIRVNPPYRPRSFARDLIVGLLAQLVRALQLTLISDLRRQRAAHRRQDQRLPGLFDRDQDARGQDPRDDRPHDRARQGG